MDIAFLDCTKTVYDGRTNAEKPHGGIENATANLAAAFAKKGHTVCVFNRCKAPITYDGVRWIPLDRLRDKKNLDAVFSGGADIVIANNDARLFDLIRHNSNSSPHFILWLHNRIKLEKTIRKGRFFSLLKTWPIAVMVGEMQKKKCSILHPFRKRYVIGHGIDPVFMQADVKHSTRPLRAIFMSQPYRGLKETVETWINKISPQYPDAEFHVFCDSEKARRVGVKVSLAIDNGIIFRSRISREQLVEELQSARLMIYPGHKDETFCLAAQEALSMGVPVVTMGIGSLQERVEHGRNGYIANSYDSMARYISQIFTDDKIWQSLHKAACSDRNEMSWEKAAGIWADEVFHSPAERGG